MKKIFSATLFMITSAILFSSCDKKDVLQAYQNGTPVTLTASVASVAPALADSSKTVVTFNWTDPAYATEPGTVKYIFEIDSTNRNFAKETTQIISGLRTNSFTGRQLNTLLLNYGFAPGVSKKLDIRVTSSYANNNEKYLSNVVYLTVTPYNDPSVLKTSNTSVVCAIGTSTQLANTFSWTSPFKGYTGDITYSIQYDSSGKGFSGTPGEIAVGKNLLSKDLTQGEMNTTAIASGISGGTTGKVEYRLKAVTASGVTSYSNIVNVTITSYTVALYLVGGSSPAGWTPSAATPMIPDPRFPGTFFAYAKLTVAGSGIKFLSENTDWGSPTIVIYGDVNGAGNTGNLTSTGGGNNVAVPSDGVYRISVDLANSKYYLQTGPIGAVGLVGDFQSWSPGTSYKMANFAPNRFIYITNMTANDQFKFHDGDQWDNSAIDKSKWYDMVNANNMVINGAGSGGNFQWTGSTGPVRMIFDYVDINNPQYVMNAATEMRLVGDGIQGVNAWDPPNSPQMTYSGNGVWTITTTLVANKDIKFLAGNAWGAFDYEDNSGQSQSTGTPRAIRWDGSNNFKTPTVTGTYTITLDEYNQTVTIN
ncbi:MAG: SusE domain-containing protein [Bacteroidetes bacterium]|nr:SusE domain-containing protein [Bacteroidota bacterium]